MVLLNVNPLDNIHNTQKIVGVIAGGRYFSRGDLDGILNGAAAYAAAH